MFIQSFPAILFPQPTMGWFVVVFWFFFCGFVFGGVFYVTKMLIRDDLELLLSAQHSSLLICSFAPIIGMKQKLHEVSARLCALVGCFKAGAREWKSWYGWLVHLWIALVCYCWILSNGWIHTGLIWESCPWMHNYHEVAHGTFESAVITECLSK